jgi:hypothetical protein
MVSIQSIICFNAGSAGDLLKILCNDQLIQNNNYYLESHGAIQIENQYFKKISKEIYYKSNTIDDIDFQKCFKIENTHFYLPAYHQITHRVFYIDYPDEYQTNILNAVNIKRHCGDWSVFLKNNLYSIPEPLHSKIKLDNVIEVFNIMWMKNLRGWQNNNLLEPLNFLDFADSTKLQDIVKNICGIKILNHEIFDDIYQRWLEKNSSLFTI